MHLVNGNAYVVEGEEGLFARSWKEVEALGTVAKALGMTRPCLFLPSETLGQGSLR